MKELINHVCVEKVLIIKRDDGKLDFYVYFGKGWHYSAEVKSFLDLGMKIFDKQYPAAYTKDDGSFAFVFTSKSSDFLGG